ncbi:MAG: adenylyltransferase/cytidyltransferase family protein [Rickettsiales bacterium]
MTRRICVSGGFDPLHAGHLAMFEEAAKLGELTVIINSDAWLLRKKGFIFLSWQERAAIIGQLRPVAHVATVDDSDNSVCEALARLKPDYFANGGDRKNDNTPEVQLCQQLGIEMVWDIGGGKTNSSSDIARRAWVERKWGRYVTLDEGVGYKVKKLVLAPGKGISLQFHEHRCEYWYVAGPAAEVRLDGQVRIAPPGGAPVVVEPRVLHQLTNPHATEPLVVIEIQAGDYLEEDDIFRVTGEVHAATTKSTSQS